MLPQLLVVREGMPCDLAGFVARARTRPLNFGSSGNANSSHLAGAPFARRAGFEMNHVPYRGGGPAVQDLLASNIDWHMATISSAAALMQAGRLRALGVTHTARVPSLPAVPTIAESGYPGFALKEWNGLYAPAGTPEAVLDRVNEAARAVRATAPVLARLEALGALPVGSPRAEIARFLAEAREAMARLVAEARITLDRGLPGRLQEAPAARM